MLPSGYERMFVEVKFTEIEIGSDYVLARRGGELRVTVLPTPPADVKRGKVRVRFSGGVIDGREDLQPLSMIDRRWGASIQENATWDGDDLIEVPGSWPPSPGQTVTWDENTGALEWVVIELDSEQPVARIEGELFGRKQQQTVPLQQLRPTATFRKPRRPSTESRSDTSPTVADECLPMEVAPVSAKDLKEFVTKLADRFVFSERAVNEYRTRLAPHVQVGRIREMMVKELKADGRPIRRNHGEYLTIRTKRFDVRLGDLEFRTKEFIHVERIYVKSKYRTKPVRSRGGRTPRPRRNQL